MKLAVMTIRDNAINAYGQPMFFVAVGAAMRAFGDEINRVAENNNMNKHPADFELYELGIYDDQTGKFDCAQQPIRVATGLQFVKGE